MKMYKRLAKSCSYSPNKRSRKDVKYIVIHYTGGKNDTAKNNVDYFATTNTRSAGAHFFVDQDGNIGRSITMNRIAWAVGGDQRSGKDGEATYFGKCTNSNSVSIELCDNATKDPSEKQIEAVKKLVKYIKKYCPNATKVIRHYDVNGKNCLPIDSTQLLTKNGWKNIDELEIGEEVMQYNIKKDFLSFSPVLDIVEPRDEIVYKCRKLEATENHRMYTKPNSRKGTWKERKWGEVLEGHKQHIVKTFSKKENKGIEISDDELRFLVWVQGDGHYMKDRNGNIIGIEFHLKKKRKIEAVNDLLDCLFDGYKTTKQSDGTWKFRIYGKENVDWCEKYLRNKSFTYDLLDMTDRQFKIFMSELLIVDGCRSANSYCSTKEINLDVVQALCATHGVRSNIAQTGVSRSVIFTEANFCTGAGCRNRESAIKKRTTSVSCVTVESGFILIRQRGQTFIVGNCPSRMVGKENKKWVKFKKAIQP